MRQRICLIAAAALLAGCSDRSPTAAVPPDRQPERYDCVAAVREGSVSCGHAPGAARATLVGSQNVNVRITSTNVHFDPATGVFSADVALTNLSQQAMGTADGVHPDTAGVRIFFNAGPVTIAGSGSVSVANPDGYDAFTVPGQPFFRYPGILGAGESTPSRSWRWQVDATVQRFAFSLYVSTRLPPVLVISEVMAHPATAVERAGEWFEVYNAGLGPVDLDGWTISSGGDAGHRIAGRVLVPARGYAVLGGSTDLTANGNTPVAYAWSEVDLANGTDDWLALRTPEGLLADSVRWGAPPGGTAVPPPVGKSLALDSLQADHRFLSGTAWSVSQGFYGDGEYGSPARRNARPLSFVTLAVGSWASCGLDAGGQAWCWGYDQNGELGTGEAIPPYWPVPAALVPVPMRQGSLRFQGIAGGYDAMCGVEVSGAVYCTNPAARVPVLSLPGSYRAIAGGSNGFCVFYTAGGTGCTGLFGSPSGGVTRTPLDFTSVSLGGWHRCGVTAAGQAYCSGYNGNGELGTGDHTNRDAFTPVLQPPGVKFTAITGGDEELGGFTCALSSQGQAYCWGGNSLGQLGGSTHFSESRPTPVKQPEGVKFTVIASAELHTCALSEEGRAYCWGRAFGAGSERMLISGVVEMRAPPGVAFSAIATGASRTCALEAGSGHAACWGSYGLTGDGTEVPRPQPVSVVR